MMRSTVLLSSFRIFQSIRINSRELVAATERSGASARDYSMVNLTQFFDEVDHNANGPKLRQLDCVQAAFGLSSKIIIYDVVVMKTIFKPEHQKTFRAVPERVCEVFPKK